MPIDGKDNADSALSIYEGALIGAILLDPSRLDEAQLIVSSGQFFHDPSLGLVYDAMIEARDRHGTLDEALVGGILAGVGSPDADRLAALAQGAPTSANAVFYAREVAEHHRRRSLRLLMQETSNGGGGSSKAMMEALESGVARIALEGGSGPKTMDQILKHDAELEASGTTAGIKTGFSQFDRMTGGLRPGEVTIIAARPSIGKSALMVNLALGAMAGGAVPIIVSLEMSDVSLAQRMIASMTGIGLEALRNSRDSMSRSDSEAFIEASGRLSSSGMLVDARGSATCAELRSLARMGAARGCNCLFIDYLQLVTGPESESRQVEVATISRTLKSLAMDSKMPVVCLSQLNRSSEMRSDHRPRLSDLRESGAIEQDADVVCLLHREEYYHLGDEEWARANPELSGTGELIIAKQRNGPIGTIRLQWSPLIASFREVPQ